MFILILLFILLMFGAITFYLSKRVFTILKYFFPRLGFKWVLIFFSALTLLMLSGVALRHPILEIISAYYMGIFIYLFAFLVLSEIALLIIRLVKAPFYKRDAFKPTVFLSAVFLALITVICACINAQVIRVTSYEIKLEGKTDISDMNIVMLSDLHIGAVGMEERLPEIVDKINSLSPELVLISGDIFDTDFGSVENPEKVIEAFRNINSVYGTFACLGNHDGGKTLGAMLDVLEKSGITVLKEEYAVIDGRLVIVGRLDSHSIGGYKSFSRGDFEEIISELDESIPVIVLDHNPSSYDTYKENADLILSGHTHKGQLFPASILTNLMYECDYGYYQKDASSPKLIVSSGVGYWGMPMRVGTKSEIVNIKFTQG